MHLPSFAIGFPIKMENSKNSTIIFTGPDEDYICELVPGDRIFMINHLGYTTEDILISADIDAQVLKTETGEAHLIGLVFIGRIDE